MAVIVLSSPKGGCGKSTLGLIIGAEFARGGAQVFLFDGDPTNKSYMVWKQCGPMPDNIDVIEDVNAHNITGLIKQYETDNTVIIVDLEGIASELTWFALLNADLVLIPMKARFLDAKIAQKIFDLVEEAKINAGRFIDYAVVFTQTKYIQTKAERKIRAALQQVGVDVIDPNLMEREAFGELFHVGGDIYNMQNIGEIENARLNAQQLARSVYNRLVKDRSYDR